ncbi:single MYB histone, partial [Trifolium pratense]
ANHKYRIATNSTKTSEKRKSSSLLLLEGRPKDSPKAEKTDVNVLSQSQIDVELLKMRGVTAQEVAAAAAKAVAEAEAAIAVAEAAAREAETMEAEAEAARVFAKAAMKALKCRRLNICFYSQETAKSYAAFSASDGGDCFFNVDMMSKALYLALDHSSAARLLACI